MKKTFNQTASINALITLAQMRFGYGVEGGKYVCIPYTNDKVCNSALSILSGVTHEELRILAKIIFSLSLYQYIMGNITADEMQSITSNYLRVDRMYWSDRVNHSRMISLV